MIPVGKTRFPRPGNHRSRLQRYIVLPFSDGGKTSGRIGHPDDRDAGRYESERRHFRRLDYFADGFGEWNSGGESCEDASSDGGDRRDVVYAERAGGRSGGV